MNTLSQTLQPENYALYRGKRFIFVADSTKYENGYIVFYSSNPATPLRYCNPLRDEGLIIRLPVPVQYDHVEQFLTHDELLNALQDEENDPAWELVRPMIVGVHREQNEV